jgi:hypothetical protein
MCWPRRSCGPRWSRQSLLVPADGRRVLRTGRVELSEPHSIAVVPQTSVSRTAGPAVVGRSAADVSQRGQCRHRTAELVPGDARRVCTYTLGRSRSPETGRICCFVRPASLDHTLGRDIRRGWLISKTARRARVNATEKRRRSSARERFGCGHGQVGHGVVGDWAREPVHAGEAGNQFVVGLGDLSRLPGTMAATGPPYTASNIC